MYFDTHAHYDDAAFDPDREALLDALPAAGVDLVVDPASDLPSALRARDIAEARSFVRFAAGIHPEAVDTADEAALAAVRALLSHPKCVAVGEIGLDYHYGAQTKEAQKALFRRQLALARDAGLPAVVHVREATEDALAAVREFPEVTGVFHCFTGSWETAREMLSLGWYLGFGGAVTFKNARKGPETAARMPLSRLLLETDCPYMAPVPHRGERNSSLLLPLVAARIGELRGVPAEEIAAAAEENGRRLFRIAD